MHNTKAQQKSHRKSQRYVKNTMKNIDEFNIAVGEILGQCYRSFPTPTSISRFDIGAYIKNEMGVESDPNYVNLGEHEYRVVEHTLSWLIQAGYIWTDNPKASAYSMQIRLSPVGLEILNSVPKSLQAKEKLGETLSKGIKSLGKEMLLTTVTTALTIGINGIST